MNRTEILNRLADIYGYQTYLEIGVDNGVNFSKIRIRNKTGVDPNPKTKATYRLTSDNFFARNKQKFDLIMIDGLHHADQVKRDIENALKFLNDNGTIFCHDCNPTTEEMQQVPRIQGEWTGDVWRAWLEFRCREDLSMNVLDTDYGCGIIRKGKQTPMHFIPDHYLAFTVSKESLLPLISEELDPVSICIPAFEQYGHGLRTLKELLDTTKRLKGKFEVIVSDNSEGYEIENLCKGYDLRYFKNPDRGISVNTNFAISKANYNLIKPMYQDDKFINPDAINQIAFSLKFDHWVTCSGVSMNENGRPTGNRSPQYTPKIMDGKNTIGMPSVIAYRKNGLTFDSNLKTMLDCDFYYRMHKEYGAPGYIKSKLIGSRYWSHSTSRQQGSFLQNEVPLLKERYGI